MILPFSSQSIHRQSQAGLHAADGQGQQSDFISRVDVDFNIKLPEAHAFGCISQLHYGRHDGAR